VDVRDLFSAIPSANASRIVFGKDGMVYMTVGIADPPGAWRAQDPNDLAGKVLRLRDDGAVPPDNPFVGRAGYRPEIYTLGHRNALGLAVQPDTGAIWECEDGPNGGDEINILQPGKNYGWPAISFGRFYLGPRVSEKPWQEGMEQPLVFWVPAIAISGLTFYTGDMFPNWKNNVFVGGMRQGEVPAPVTSSGSISTTSGRNSTVNRCSANCNSEFAMCGRAPMAICTCLLPKTMAL